MKHGAGNTPNPHVQGTGRWVGASGLLTVGRGFQHDNGLTHSHSNKEQLCEEKKKWPSQSLDLNPTETPWTELKVYVAEQHCSVRSGGQSPCCGGSNLVQKDTSHLCRFLHQISSSVSLRYQILVSCNKLQINYFVSVNQLLSDFLDFCSRFRHSRRVPMVEIIHFYMLCKWENLQTQRYNK